MNLFDYQKIYLFVTVPELYYTIIIFGIIFSIVAYSIKYIKIKEKKEDAFKDNFYQFLLCIFSILGFFIGLIFYKYKYLNTDLNLNLIKLIIFLELILIILFISFLKLKKFRKNYNYRNFKKNWGLKIFNIFYLIFIFFYFSKECFGHDGTLILSLLIIWPIVFYYTMFKREENV